MTHPAKDGLIHEAHTMSDEDKRPVQGILNGVGAGAAIWLLIIGAIVAAVWA